MLWYLAICFDTTEDMHEISVNQVFKRARIYKGGASFMINILGVDRRNDLNASDRYAWNHGGCNLRGYFIFVFIFKKTTLSSLKYYDITNELFCIQCGMNLYLSQNVWFIWNKNEPGKLWYSWIWNYLLNNESIIFTSISSKWYGSCLE